MFDFKGINFESIKLRLGSLIGQVFHKEEHAHNEKTLNLDQSKTYAGDYVEKQYVLKLPEGLSQTQQKKLIAGVMGEKNTEEIEETEPSEAQGNAQLPVVATINKRTENFLCQRLKENNADNSLLLDRGGLFLIYKERESISFSKEGLVFLVRSSLKYKFPVWFWAFYYREHFENVTPLFQEAYRYPSLIVRCAVIKAFGSFTDTGDSIVELAENEQDSNILGFIASNFLEKEDAERAQRVIANALTRRIVPAFTEKGKKKMGKMRIDLGAAEKRFLYSEVEKGWPEEKIQALNLLSVSAEERDLPTLENLLDKATYANITDLIFACIGRIGKTNKAKDIERELIETRRIETFFAALDTLVAVRYKALFPQLLEWLSNAERITGRVWGEVDERKVEEKIQDAIFALLDEQTYEQLVQYILKRYSPDEYGNIMSWRHFWVLRESKDNPQITPLLQTETRLKEFEKWADVVSEVELEEKTSAEDKEKLLSFVTPKNLSRNIFILRKAYKIITPEQALAEVTPIIEQLRSNLTERLGAVTSGEHPQDIKDIAKNDLENFFGENKGFYRIHRKQKGGSRYKVEGGEDKIFEELSKDIDSFDTIEKEYLQHVFKAKSPESNKKLLLSLGRPFECIYKNIQKDTASEEELKKALSQVIDSHPNPMVQLDAIEAALRTEVMDAQELRKKVLIILIGTIEKAKSSRGMTKGNDDWYVDEITYMSAINTLTEFGCPDDFPLIEEAVNKEKIIARYYYRYSHFFDYNVFANLLNLTETLEDNEERENAFSALDTLDYKWSKKVLNIEA